ncbi:MAG: OmpA family protein [Rhizomicrobium sp.]
MRRLLWLSIIAVLAGCTVMGPSPVPATKTFVVFFDSASARLTPAAQADVDLAAATIKSTHPAHVSIAVYIKAATGDPANPRLADPRFDAVEAALVADGVDPHILVRRKLTDMEVHANPSGDRRAEIHLLKD